MCWTQTHASIRKRHRRCDGRWRFEWRRTGRILETARRVDEPTTNTSWSMRQSTPSEERLSIHHGAIAHSSKMARCSLPRRCRPIGENASLGIQGIRACCFFPGRTTQKQAIAVAVAVAVAVTAFLADWSHSQRSGVLCRPTNYQVTTYHQQRLDLDAFICCLRVSASPIPLGRCRPASCLLAVSKSTTIRRITSIPFLPSICCLPYCSRLPTVPQFRPRSWFFWVIADPRAIELLIYSFSSSGVPVPVTDISVQQSMIAGDCGFLHLGVMYRYTPFLNRFTGS